MPLVSDTLRAQVERYKRRAQLLTLAEGVSQTLAVFLGLLAVTFLLDRWLFLPLFVRIALTLLVWGATIAGFVKLILLPLRKRWGDIEVAFNVEAVHPELNEALETVLELDVSRDPDAIKGSAQLIEALVNDLARRTTNLDFASAISPKRAAASGAAALALMLGLGFYAVVATDHFALLFKRFANPLAALPRASSVKLDVKPGDAEVEAGSGITVRVTASNPRVSKATVFFKADGLPMLRFASERVAGPMARFEIQLPGVKSNAVYFVRAGDAESKHYRLTAQRGPRLQSFTITYHYPDYTKRAPRTLKAETADIAAVEGTRVVIQAESVEPLREAHLEMNGSPPQPLALADERNVFVEITVDHDAEFRLRVTSTAGFRNSDAISYHVKALPDAPPTVTLIDPESDMALGKPEPVELRFEAEDDFGVSSVYLVHNNKREPLPAGGTAVLDVAKAGYRPGDEVTYWIEVEDNSPAHQVGKSDPRKLFISETADLSLQNKDFAGLKKLREALAKLDKLVSESRRNAEQLRAEFARTGQWDANLGARAGALGQDMAAAQDAARAALAIVATCNADPKTPQVLRDWENVGNLLDQLLERAATVQRGAELLRGAQAAAPGSALGRVADTATAAADVAAKLDANFTRLYDTRQMDVLAQLSRKIYRNQQRIVANASQSVRTYRRNAAADLATQQQAVSDAVKQLAAGLGVVDAALPQNTETLQAARERLATAIAPRMETAKTQRNHSGRQATTSVVESMAKTSDDLSRVARASADAANTARSQFESSRVELSQRFAAAATVPAGELRERMSDLVARIDQQSEPHLTQRAGDAQWGADLLLVRSALQEVSSAGSTSQAVEGRLKQLAEQLNLLERQRDLRLMVRSVSVLETSQRAAADALEQAGAWQRLRFGEIADTEREVRGQATPLPDRLSALAGRVAPVDGEAARIIERVGREFASRGAFDKLDAAASAAEAADKNEALPRAREAQAELELLRAALEQILKTRLQPAQQARAELKKNQPPPQQQIEKLARQQDALAKKTEQTSPTGDARQQMRQEQQELRADARALERSLMTMAKPPDESQQPPAEQMRDLHDAAMRVAEVEREEMKSAQQALAHNQPAEAVKQQQAAAEKLHQTAQQLAAVDKNQKLAAQAEQAAALQKQQEQMLQTAQASQPQALPAQAQAQKSLAAQTQALAQAAQKSAPQSAQSAQQAQQAMQQAANALQAANQKAATDNQQAAAQGLQKMADALKQAMQEASQEAQQARDQLQQAERPLPNAKELAEGYEWLKKLNEVANKQTDVAKRAAANDQPKPLAQQQSDVKQQMKSELQSDPAIRAAQLDQTMEKLKADAQAVAELARKEQEVASQVSQVHSERDWRQKEFVRRAKDLAKSAERAAKQAPNQAAPLQQSAQAMNNAADALQREDNRAAQQQAEANAQSLSAQAQSAKENAQRALEQARKNRSNDQTRKATEDLRGAEAMRSQAQREAELAKQLQDQAASRQQKTQSLAENQTQMSGDLQQIGERLADAREMLNQTAPDVARQLENAPEAATQKIPSSMRSSADNLRSQNTPQALTETKRSEAALNQLADQLNKAIQKTAEAAQSATAMAMDPVKAAEETAPALEAAGKQMQQAQGAFEKGQTPQGHPPAQAAAQTLQALVNAASQSQQQEVVAAMQAAEQAAQQAERAAQAASRESNQGSQPRNEARSGTSGQLKLNATLADLDKLPAELQQGMAQGLRESYPPEYEKLIKQYFQKLSKQPVK